MGEGQDDMAFNAAAISLRWPGLSASHEPSLINAYESSLLARLVPLQDGADQAERATSPNSSLMVQATSDGVSPAGSKQTSNGSSLTPTTSFRDTPGPWTIGNGHDTEPSDLVTSEGSLASQNEAPWVDDSTRDLGLSDPSFYLNTVGFGDQFL
jgi:hypothetical protein